MQIRHSAIAGLALALGAGYAAAQDIKIAHVYDKTGRARSLCQADPDRADDGPGVRDNGTMKVNGRKLVVIEKDSQFKPDVGKSQLASAFADDKADIAIGPTGSGVALAMLPVAEEYKKILLVEPAVADRSPATNGTATFSARRNSVSDAISNAVALDKAGVSVATLAQDLRLRPATASRHSRMR